MTREDIQAFAAFAGEQATSGGNMFRDGLHFTVEFCPVIDGIVHHDMVRVTNAPHAFVTAVTDWANAGKRAGYSIDGRGLLLS